MPALIEAGLPELEGTFWDYGMSDLQNLSGAFSKSSYSDVRGGHQTTSFPSAGVQFKASNSNSIYGNSDTVQPPAICLIPQIKF